MPPDAKREQAHVSSAMNGDPEGPQRDVLGRLLCYFTQQYFCVPYIITVTVAALIQSSWTQPIKANTSLAAERRDDVRHCVMRDSVELLAASTAGCSC